MAIYISFVEWGGPASLPVEEHGWFPSAGLAALAEGHDFQMIDVRPDQEAQPGHVFVWADAPLTTGSGYLFLGDDPTSLVTDEARAAIFNRYAITVPQGTTVRELVHYYRGHYGTTDDDRFA